MTVAVEQTIILTNEWTKSPAARAVPGAYWSPEDSAWVLNDPTARSAVVALKLFPHLMHTYPELVELRDSALQDAKPVDYAGQLKLCIGARRVREQMVKRGWSLGETVVSPIGCDSDYQEIDLGYAAACLREHDAFYLAWARGLGKTLGTAALIDELDSAATLIIAPNTSKQSVWADELAWACPWLNVIPLRNEARKREYDLAEAKRAYDEGRPFVLIVHYEALAVIAGRTAGKQTGTGRSKKVLGDGWKRLGIHWYLKVADEGHRFANPDTLMTRAAKKVPASKRLVLSGSVFQNRWEELYGPLSFLFPDRYKSKWRDFNDRFLDYVENGYGKICVGIRPERIDALRDELGRFMVMREKENKAQASEHFVSLTPGQQKVYDDLAGQLLAELPNGDRIKSSDGIAVLTRLRQVATGLDLFTHEVQDSSKLEACVDLIKQNWDRGDDYVVFGWYKASLEALALRLADAGIECWIIHGDVPQTVRAEIIRDFQSGYKRVLLGTISTMGESVNLQRANHVIRLDRSFNPALNQQAVDRVDRQGQMRECYLTDIIAEDTVDDLVVLPNLANKEALRAVVWGRGG